jgi:hypothetical protein
VGAKGIQKTSLGDAFRHSLTSPLGIAVQIAMIALLVGLTQVDWESGLGAGAKSANDG